MKMSIIDSSIGSLANAFRYNYADQEGCSLLIDIGAKTSNVLLFEAGKYYGRSINVGSNAITQEFAAEAKLRFDDAEKFKLAEGFVSLGGAYEEPDDPKQAAVSKVARNVLTRLHLQVNQTVQFYRTQQGGAAPVRVFLCGGGSILPYASQFFQEKLNLPFDFLNPFRNIEIDPTVAVADLEKVAQCFGEVVGVGLRNVAQCPVEFNLMPKASLNRQQFNSKKPFLLAAAFVLAGGVFASGWFHAKLTDARHDGLDNVKKQVDPLEHTKTTLEAEEAKLKRSLDEAAKLGEWLQARTLWSEMFSELRGVMKNTEDEQRKILNQPVGVWIDSFISAEVQTPIASGGEEEQQNSGMSRFMNDPVLAKRYGLMLKPQAAAADAGAEGKPAKAANTNELSTIKVTFRAVNLNEAANNQLIYALEKAIKASPSFDREGTQLSGSLEKAEANATTFSFPLSLKLKRPIKL
jgi:hypothetical protein